MNPKLQILVEEGADTYQTLLAYTKDHKITKPLSLGQITQWVDDVHRYATEKGWVVPERGNSLAFVLGWEDPSCDYVGRLLNVLKIYASKYEKDAIADKVAVAADSSEFYDIVLSFAGEQREFVRRIAEGLQESNLKVFFDEYEKANLWGKNLYDHLFEIYNKRALFCIMFISEAYAKKLWTNHERSAAQAAAFSANREFILPVRLDDTKLPGLPETIGYIDARKVTAAEIVRMAVTKVRTAA
jgi:hypothetical protein